MNPSQTGVMELDLMPTRQSLLSRLKNWDDQGSWRQFFDTYWKLIYTAAVRSGLTEPEAQDVVQETIIAVAKKMQGFEYQHEGGSFRGWLLTLTRWRIIDQFRKRRKLEIAASGPEGLTDTGPLDHIPDPASLQLEAIWDAEWEQNLAEAALERVKRQVDPKEVLVFDLLVKKGWPVKKISTKLGMNLARVYYAKYKVGALLKKEIARLKNNQL
jgi:RNA polymerase sigma-70 factor (ECF subfamily)